MRVQPRASRNAVGGERSGALAVRVTRPPADGAANQAVVRLLAGELGLPPSTIRIKRGGAGRDKLLLFEGVSVATLLSRLARLEGR